MPHTIVIFGASGDLTSRKLIPSLFALDCRDRLPDEVRIVGASRTPMEHDAWRASLAETTRKFAPKLYSEEAWARFAPRVFYHATDVGDADQVKSLAAFLQELDGGGATRAYYLATAPRHYEPAVATLHAAGLSDDTAAPRRIVIEKPFGVDLTSARRLNDALHGAFREDQVYRIDHYLGKETVQNLMVLRFANGIFEPIWNRTYIDHVQITVAEEVDVGGRADYYDRSGVLRDMFQNHLLQLMMITAMETPARFEADSVRNEKAKVLQAVRPWDDEMLGENIVCGQYAGYRDA
ncbi:MAG: glucose-6-phosphate dehydrogenase (NADP(+)), partial [Planctomycetales bacterium]|nr:glucose-6-phosphate dehydrogenase (NADP(+)) [Planctomycetales bacterium]